MNLSEGKRTNAQPTRTSQATHLRYHRSRKRTVGGQSAVAQGVYYAHLYYWQRGSRVLTSYPVVRLPFGPGIDHEPNLVTELVRAGKLHVAWQPNGPFKEAVFELTEPFQIDPTSPRYRAIEDAVARVRDKSASELSDETHVFSRSWQAGQNGDELDIYSDLLNDMEYQQIQDDAQQSRELVHGVFQPQG